MGYKNEESVLTLRKQRGIRKERSGVVKIAENFVLKGTSVQDVGAHMWGRDTPTQRFSESSRRGTSTWGKKGSECVIKLVRLPSLF